MRFLHPLGACRPLLQCPASCRLVDRMNRAPPAIVHVRLRCWLAWMAAGPLRGGSSRWAASAHPALAVQVG